MVARLKSNMIDSWWQTIMVARLLVARLVREHCYSCVEVLGKLLIPWCLCPPSTNGYLVKSAADIPGKVNGWVHRAEITDSVPLPFRVNTHHGTHFKSVNIFCKLYRCIFQWHTLIRNTGNLLLATATATSIFYYHISFVFIRQILWPWWYRNCTLFLFLFLFGKFNARVTRKKKDVDMCSWLNIIRHLIVSLCFI